MTEENKSKYVNLQEYIDKESWADAVDYNEAPTVAQPKVWQIENNDQKDLTMEEIMAQEEQRKAEAAARPKPKPKPVNPPPAERSYDRAPPRGPPRTREKQPVPTEPPFTAFVGNLPYEVREDEIKAVFISVVNVRIIKDPVTGKGKGYGYVEFDSADALKEALNNPGQLDGRELNIDVAKPPTKQTWGRTSESYSRPSDSSSFSSYGRQGDSYNRQGDSYGRQGDSYGRQGDSFNRPKPTGERPKLNINPVPKVEIPKPKPKSSGEDPYGSANMDKKKLDEIAEQRLRREMEREAKKKEEEERRRNAEKRPLSARDPQPWRSVPSSTFNRPSSPRTTGPSTNFRNDRFEKTDRVTDTEGFRSTIPRRQFEAIGTGSAVRASEDHVTAKQYTRNPRNDRQEASKVDSKTFKNRYEGLGEEDI